MGEVLGDIATYGLGAICGAAVLCGLCPRLILRLMLLVYPRNDERRPELLAELSRIPYRERLMWVADQSVTAVFDGTLARLQARSHRRRELDIRLDGVNERQVELLNNLTSHLRTMRPGDTVSIKLDGMDPDLVPEFLRQQGAIVMQVDCDVEDVAEYSLTSPPSVWKNGQGKRWGR